MAAASIANRITGIVVRLSVVTLVFFVADLVTKRLITRWLGPNAAGHEAWLVDGKVGFAYGRNSGAAFGLFQGNAELLAILSIFVAFGFCWLILAEVQRPVARMMSASMVMGGALGNLAERLWHGYVTDFIAVGPWPRFNLADSVISIGVIIFAFAVISQPDSHEAESYRMSSQQSGQGGRNRESE